MRLRPHDLSQLSCHNLGGMSVRGIAGNGYTTLRGLATSQKRTQELLGDCQYTVLVCLQSDLLRKHDIARDKVANGHKTPASSASPRFVKLNYVRRGALIDTISPAAVAAGNIEISVSLELRALLA